VLRSLKLIIEAAGGLVLPKPSGEEKAVLVSTDDERKAWSGLLKKHKGLEATRPEHVLTCGLQQQWRLSGDELLQV
jgi:hypothetical protein